MYDKGKILVGLLIGIVLLLFPVYYNAGRAAKAPDPCSQTRPRRQSGAWKTRAVMKVEHMKMLDEWRQEVVRDDLRYYKSSDGKTHYKSLQLTCMECHSNKTKFCDQCHNYMGVAPYCWDCHIAPKENG